MGRANFAFSAFEEVRVTLGSSARYLRERRTRLSYTAAPVSMDPSVLVSGHETVFEGSQIEGTGRRRCRNAQGGRRKDFLGVDAHHKALAKEASGNRGRPAKSDPWQASQ